MARTRVPTCKLCTQGTSDDGQNARERPRAGVSRAWLGTPETSVRLALSRAPAALDAPQERKAGAAAAAARISTRPIRRSTRETEEQRMPGISRKETLKANAASAYALALQLAQDRKFRNWLISAIYHASAAGKRTRRDLGLRGTVAGLAADETLLKELRSARRDLKQAYGRLEAKKRTHKLRNFLLLAALASLAAVPQLRARLGAVSAKASKVREGRSAVGARSTSDSSGARPRRLEDLTKEELYARAQEADIPGRSEMSKEQLVEVLRARS